MTLQVDIGYDALDKWVKALEDLTDESTKMCKRAIYDGGKVVGDEMKRQIKTIPELPEHPGKHSEHITGATRAQIDGLIESMGLAPMKKFSEAINTKIGFDGYNSVVTKKYPKGQPNMMIARSINSGTSFRNKFPFVERAAQNSEQRAIKAMSDSLQNSINTVTREFAL